MDNVNTLKTLLIFDYYNNFYHKNEQPLRTKISPNRFRIIKDFENFNIDKNEGFNTEKKPKILKYTNDKLFNILLKNIYKRLDCYNFHISLKKNMQNDLKNESTVNIYNLAFEWCKYKYY